MKEATSINRSFADYSSILRVISGQDREPEYVLVEHSYARSWNWIPGPHGSHPRKTLFLSIYPKNETSESDEINVVDLDSKPPLPYDLAKGKKLMNECTFYASQKEPTAEDVKDFSIEETEEEDWCDKINKDCWTENQTDLFSNIVKIFDDERLGRLAMKDSHNEPVKRRNLLDRNSARFRSALVHYNWEAKLSQWLHLQLIKNMSKTYLAAYYDILQTLKSKIPTLIERMVSLWPNQKDPAFEAFNSLLKRPWDPISISLNQNRLQKLECRPVFLIIPSSPQIGEISRRLRFFNSQLQSLMKGATINVENLDMTNGESILQSLASRIRQSIAEARIEHPGQPIVLIGWGIGGLLASLISLFEKVSAVVCLGFPMHSSLGMRGEADDPLLESKTPTLFVIGDKSTNCPIDDLEDMRHRMTAETSLVVISEADNLLRMSLEKRYSSGITQTMVDRSIAEEIAEFFKFVLSGNTQSNYLVSTSQVHSSFANPLPPKTFRRLECPTNKRKLSSSADAANTPPSKVFRAGTNLSQNLGLKIPVSSTSLSVHTNEKIASNSPYEEESASSTELPSGAHLQIGGTENLTISEVVNTPKSEFVGLSEVSASDNFSTVEATNLSQSFMNSSGVATIALGSIASISQQKYQKMFEGSESRMSVEISDAAPKAISSQANRLSLSADIGSEVSIMDEGGEVAGRKPKSSARRSTDSSQILVTSSLMTPKTSSALSNFGKNISFASTIPSAVSVAVSNFPTPPVAKWHKRGRPPSNKRLGPGRGGSTRGSTSTRGTRGRGRGRGQSYSRGTALNGRKRNEGVARRGAAVASARPSQEETAMAVLTLTGNGGEGSVELAAEGISPLGRGFITLAKGGTSTVRVFSANSSKLSSSAVTTITTPDSSSSNSLSAIRGTPSPSFVFTNISNVAQSDASTSTNIVPKLSGPSLLNIGNFVVAGKRERIVTTDAKTLRSVLTQGRKSVMASGISAITSVTQSSLNIQGISASRGISSSKIVPTTRSIGTIKPTMIVLSSASDSTPSISTVSSSPVHMLHSPLNKISSESFGAIECSVDKEDDLILSGSETVTKNDSMQFESTSKINIISIDTSSGKSQDGGGDISKSSDHGTKADVRYIPISTSIKVTSNKEDFPSIKKVSSTLIKSQVHKKFSRIQCIGSSLPTERVLSPTTKAQTSGICTLLIPPNLKENKTSLSGLSNSPSSPTLRLIKTINSPSSAPSTTNSIITKTFTISSGNIASVKTGIRRISLDDLKIRERSTVVPSFEPTIGTRATITPSDLSSSRLIAPKKPTPILVKAESQAVVTVSNSVKTPIVTSVEIIEKQAPLQTITDTKPTEDDSIEVDVEDSFNSSIESLSTSSDSDITIISSSTISKTKDGVNVPSTSSAFQKARGQKSEDGKSEGRITRSSSKSPMKVGERRNLRSSL